MPTEAGKLTVGDRIWAPTVYEDTFKRNVMVGTTDINMQPISRAYEELLHGPLPNNIDVHHKDENHQNNREDNLERLTMNKHRSQHLTKRLLALSPEERKEWALRGSSAAAKVATPEFYKECYARGLGIYRASPESHENQSKFMRAGHAKKMSLAAAKVATPEFYKECGRKGNTSRWKDPEQRKRQSELMKRLNREGRLRANHKVVAIRHLQAEPVYDFTVEDYHTALIGDGVLAHNCYGANAVHFSFLQEYMAAGIGVPVGVYYQMSNNYHLYTDVLDLKKADQIIGDLQGGSNYYAYTSIAMQPSVPLVADFAAFYADACYFLDDPWNNAAKHVYKNAFFTSVALPMYRVWKVRKTVPRSELDMHLDTIKDSPWRIACQEWIYRKEERWKVK